MNCVVCKNGELLVKDVKEEVHKGSDVIIVSITIPVCNQCGERYYDMKTMKYLETIEHELKLNAEKLTEVGKVLVYA